MRVNNVIVESRNAKLTTRMSDEFYGNGSMRSSIGIVKYFECFYNFIRKIGDITNLRWMREGNFMTRTTSPSFYSIMIFLFLSNDLSGVVVTCCLLNTDSRRFHSHCKDIFIQICFLSWIYTCIFVLYYSTFHTLLCLREDIKLSIHGYYHRNMIAFVTRDRRTIH